MPAADANALSDGNWTVTATGHDAAGNTVTGSQLLKIDSQPPTITVNPIAQDDIINIAEHNAPLVVSGKTTAEAGQTVTLNLNGQSHTATVASDGTWQVTLSASEVNALANGNHSLTASVNDKAGNNGATTASFQVDISVPVVTINPIAGDDVLNGNEQGVAQIITGHASGAEAGDVVTVTVGTHTYTGVVQADGNWSLGVPATVFSSLGQGSHIITANVTDAAGNAGIANHSIVLVRDAPVVTLDPISQDNVLNAQEATQPLTLSGTTNLPDDSTVTVTLNGVQYTATVASGVWSVQVPVADVVDLVSTTYTVTASGTNAAGNTGTAQAPLQVDTLLPQVIIDTFAGNNLVNNAEAGIDQTLSGRVTNAAEGDTVTITAGGNSYTATVGSDLTWNVTIPSGDLTAFGDGPLTFTATVTNSRGNTGSGDLDVSINTGLPGLRINTISGDDVINSLEQRQDLTITGTSTHLPQGTVVTVTINNVDYQAVINSSGNWQIGLQASELQSWPTGSVTVTASAEDSFGNPVSVDHPVTVEVSAVAIAINTVSGDDILNAAEKGAALTISGQTQGVEAGRTVVIKFADQTFTAQVQNNGTWSVSVPASAMETLADGREQISASVTSGNGNSADSVRVVTVDTQAPTLTIENLTADNIISAAEAQQDLTLSGTSNAPQGQTVTVTLNGKTYQTTVQADGSWSVNVPANDVGALADGNVTVTASVSDPAGNSRSVDRIGLVDASLPVVTINAIAGDDVINRPEHAQAQIINGTVTGAEAGALVTVTINSVDYTTVVDSAGHWSLGLPASVVSGLNNGTYTVSVSVTDRSGNTGTETRDVVVNVTAPVITINTIAGDDLINAVEKGADVLISGTSNQPAGTGVTVTLNGKNYSASIDALGNWSVTVPASAVSALGEATYTVTASVTSGVGNSGQYRHRDDGRQYVHHNGTDRSGMECECTVVGAHCDGQRQPDGDRQRHQRPG
ncbi:hypothetical protein GM30_23075, partial [Trabulsiella odontotermitis]